VTLNSWAAAERLPLFTSVEKRKVERSFIFFCVEHMFAKSVFMSGWNYINYPRRPQGCCQERGNWKSKQPFSH
jgi:hypothetical protein